MRAEDKTCSEANGTWAGSRETNLHSGLGRTFFLTSLFIELKIPGDSLERRIKGAKLRYRLMATTEQ